MIVVTKQKKRRSTDSDVSLWLCVTVKLKRVWWQINKQSNKFTSSWSKSTVLSQLTLEKKILPPILLGFELATFRSQVRRSYQQAIPALFQCLFYSHVTAVVHKRPQSFCQNTGSRLHLHTHAPLTQRSWSGLTMPLSSHSVGTYPEKCSHTTCQGTVGHCLSLLRHRGLILA